MECGRKQWQAQLAGLALAFLLFAPALVQCAGAEADGEKDGLASPGKTVPPVPPGWTGDSGSAQGSNPDGSTWKYEWGWSAGPGGKGSGYVGEAVAEEAEERLVHAIGDTEDIPVAMVATVLVVIMGKARLAAKMVALAGTSAVDSAVEGRRRSRTVAAREREAAEQSVCRRRALPMVPDEEERLLAWVYHRSLTTAKMGARQLRRKNAKVFWLATEQSEGEAAETAADVARVAELKRQQDRAVRRRKGPVVIYDSSSDDDRDFSTDNDDHDFGSGDPPAAANAYN
ncbi:hypothetical protein TRIUR3_19933 [Triticum urartu]|uniref:Uncharacterized protein n=1 Tax=Triticum urartu TaxID=4572 RepID=M7YJL2_TRIUA|nr:hypothetical protein TRIUR3_19933 [Triticum urartu]